MQLFAGLMSAHGKYRLDGSVQANGKKRGTAITLNEPVTVELWSQHLSGVSSLGVVPIRNDNTCRFGAIDIDAYDIDLRELSARIQVRNLPLVLCRTKSGGAHLYIFFSDDIPAAYLIDRLRTMASALGYGKAEVFPKQARLLVERGDVGSWINMPYFGADKTDRYALGPKGLSLNLQEFINYARSLTLSRNEFDALSIEAPEILPDGPPCLQRLTLDGFPEGTRNSGLFNLGIYAKKATPDAWKQKLEDYNQRFMNPPLTAVEVLGVIKALDKHDYNYTCKTQPIEAVCNADKCRRCKFGIGKGDFGMPKFGSLTKLCTTPPIWFIDIEGGHRLELTTEELQSPVSFQRRCMEVLHAVPGIPKRNEWTDILSELFENVNVVEVPRQATPKGHLLSLFEEFITSRVQAKSKEEIMLGKPYTVGDTTYFRMKDVIKFLDRQRFTMFQLNEIVSILRDEHDVKEHRFNINGTIICCMKIPAVTVAKIEPSDLPSLPKNDDPV